MVTKAFNPFLKKILAVLKDSLSTKLSGVFIYGSMANSGYNQETSGCDLFSLKQCGICLFGEPIDKIIPNISREYYLKSAKYDFEWAYNNVMEKKDTARVSIPAYAVLNSCRIVILIRKNLHTSKIEGGEWGLKNFPKKFRPIIKTALKDYKQREKSNEVYLELLKEFMKYAKDIVDKEA